MAEAGKSRKAVKSARTTRAAAAGSGTPGSGKAGKRTPGHKKAILFGLTGVGLLALGGAVAVFSGATASLVGKGESNESVLGPSVYQELPQMLVDLKSDRRDRRSYIRLRVMAELDSSDDALKLKAQEAEVVDRFHAYVRDKQRADLEGSAGTESLRVHFVDIINQAIRPAKARNVLFREIVMQ